MKIIFGFLLLTLMLSSCFVSKQVRLAKGGDVVEKEFNKEIKFEYFKGFIYVPVTIKEKTYNFIFDSGAFMNVISVELAAELNLKEEVTSNVNSSSGRKQQSGMVALPSAKIGGIEFAETGTIIQDLDGLNSFLGCHAIDGIIGNNLMRKANWKIDYENEVLYLTNNSEAFPFTDQAKFIELSNKKWGNKHLNISVNGIEDSYTFDTGFSGFIQNDLKFYDKLMSKDSTLDFVSLRGLLSADLYGATFSETHLFIFDSLSLGAVTIQNQRMKMKKKGSSLIGNQFFEAFDLTMDWDNNRLILDPIKGFEADTIKAFEVLIAPNYAETSLEVKGDWLIDTDLKIKMGSKVVEVNGKDVSSFTMEELCDYWDNQWKDIIKGEKLEIIVLEDEVEKNYTLTKRQYLPY